MKKKLFIAVLCVAWIIPTCITLYNVFSGGMAFWYDPARDLLSAWDNLSKLTLIGSTSGIPGIFYGPYWIWWLSVALLFSKDPRIVLFFTTALPYIIVFPAVLYLFSKIFSRWVSIILWLLFFIGFQGYMTALWNPNLAPLLFLVICYILVTFIERKQYWQQICLVGLAGIFTGLVLNIHISFSSGFVIGCLLFLLLTVFYQQKRSVVQKIIQTLSYLVTYGIGIIFVFWPFFLFEIRHGFMQTKALINALSHQGGVVGIQGLSKPEIILSFFASGAKLLGLPNALGIVFLIGISMWFLLMMKREKITFSFLQIRLVVLLLTITISVLGIYLLAKNPIWGYHFIGAEIVWLLCIGLIMTKVRWLQFLFTGWVSILLFTHVIGIFQSLSLSPLRIDTLYTKEYIVRLIIADAKSQTYTVYPYNSAIYTYDYSYLFRWLGNKNFSYDPGNVHAEGIVYLIIPLAKQSVRDDFINFHTPNALYHTAKTWHIPDGVEIVKRVPLLTKKK